jgi:AsmA protein
VKILKWVLAAALGVALLAAIAIAAAVAVVDGAFVKARLEAGMKARNRVLAIEGVPTLRLFPVAGIALGKASLSEVGGGKPFLSLDSAEVAVRVLPLLSGELAIETLKVSGLRANLVRRKDGSMNFSDLGGAPDKEGKSGRPPTLRIAEVQVEKLHLSFRDEATGQELNVTELGLKTGRLDGQTPGDIALSARLVGKRPEVDLRAQASGALSFNLRRDEFAFDKFVAQLKGRIDQETIAAEFSAPKVQVASSRASGSQIKGSLQVRGARSIDLAYTVSLSGPPLAMELVAKLDDSNIKAKAELADLSPLKASFDLEADRLNLDRYFPPERRDANPNRAIDLSGLKGKTVHGKLAVGALVYRRAKLENVKAEIRLANGKLELSPHSASLYGGSLAGELSADADGNKIRIKEKAQNVAVGALLRDVTQKDFVEGRGNLTLDIQSAGATVNALKKALAGDARVEMKEGAIKGVNLAEAVRKGKPSAAQRTDFSDLSATLKIKNGVARNDDLKAQSPLLRLTGAGNLDIGNNGIDYVAKGTMGGGVVVPVKISGALDNPSWSVDYTGLAGGMVGGAAEGVKRGAGSITDSVRGLFKR